MSGPLTLRVRELALGRRDDFTIDDDLPPLEWFPRAERAVWVDDDAAWVTVEERSTTLPPDVSIGACVLYVERARNDFAVVRRRLADRWDTLNATSARVRLGQRQITAATRCLCAVLAHLPGWEHWPRPRDCRLLLCQRGPALLVPVTAPNESALPLEAAA